MEGGGGRERGNVGLKARDGWDDGGGGMWGDGGR